MLSLLKKLFGGSPAVDYRKLVTDGAIILDVRTRGEYQGGHIRGSMNIPLNELPASAGRLDKSKPIITCCASGMRSSTAKSLLKNLGFSQVHNGGGWTSLRNSLS